MCELYGSTTGRVKTSDGRLCIIPQSRNLKGEKRQKFDSLEAQDGYCLVETIQIDRSLATIATDNLQHSQELGGGRLADIQHGLDGTRVQQEEIARKIQYIGLRREIPRECPAGMAYTQRVFLTATVQCSALALPPMFGPTAAANRFRCHAA